MGQVRGVMNKTLTVIVDADVLIAQIDRRDALYQRSLRLLQYLKKNNARVIYPVTAIIEAGTHLQRAQNNPEAALSLFQSTFGLSTEIVEVNKTILKSAMKYFSTKASKKNTIFDCIVAVLAEEMEANAILSFDKFYRKQGFKLVSDIVGPAD